MEQPQSPLAKLLQQAEEATSLPEDPAGGIPPQKLPNWLRKTLQSLLLPLLLLEIGMEKLAKKIIRPPFTKVGSCKRRGNCCHYILLPQVKGILGPLLLFWHTEINGFYPRTNLSYEYEGQEILVMGCRYLKKDGSCSNYRFRPKVCRSWPLIELFGYPKILKGCGYQAKLKKSAAKKYPKLQIFSQETQDS